jgi:TatD DNase family protein
MFVDIHAHLNLYKIKEVLVAKTLMSSHQAADMDQLLRLDDPLLWRALGVHPQDPNPESMQSLERILANPLQRNLVDAIGEIGFDLYGDYKLNLSNQTLYFNRQLQLAQHYSLPIVVHQRKAMSYIFRYVKELKRLPAVILHGYSGTYLEAVSLRKQGVNAYFSIGTPLLWGAKVANQLACQAPLEWLFLETDAPYQPVRSKEFTSFSDIHLIYAEVARLRNIAIADLALGVEENFKSIFLVKK